MISKTQILEREKKWALLAGIASVAGVAIIFATLSGTGNAAGATVGLADRLRDIQGATGSLWAASIGQAIGWALLAIPLAFIFKAAAARSERVRSALIGVVIAGPIMLGVGGLLSAAAAIQASDDFVTAPRSEVVECVDERIADESGDGADAEPVTPEQREDFQTECEDEQAADYRGGTSLSGLETGFKLAGLLGFVVALVYTSLWAMRTGLLTRFWGSLGIALGAVFFLFYIFTLVWFIYAGLLLAGWVPGGRPRAWAAGEALPWQKPGQKPADEVIEGTGEEIDPSTSELGSGDEPARVRDDSAPDGDDSAPDGDDSAPDGDDSAPDGGDSAPDSDDSAPDGDDSPQVERRKRKKRND